MPNVIINDIGAVEQFGEYSSDPTQGGNTVRRFKGNQTSIQALESSFMLAGCKTSVRSGAIWELTVTYGYDIRQGGELPVDTWEILPNEAEKDILQSDSTAVSGVSATDIATLRAAIDGSWDTANDYPVWKYPSAGDPDNLYKLICAGVKSKTLFYYVLQHTKTVSRGYQIPAALTGVGEVYSTGLLKTSESIPPLIAGSMTASGYKTRSDGTSVYKGWLKKGPTIVVAAFNKSQIVQQWQWGEWASLLYTIHTA